jgi:dTDP-4-amino-4,6-dideoxygalactose transaminase
VHLHGLTADMDPIIGIADRAGVIVIEDAAQAHGAAYKGRPAGSIGSMGCFSFYPGKNLGAFGEGGAVVTNSSKLARQIALLRDWGQESKYNHVVPGYNFRMDGIQGAVLNVKMGYIERWTEARQAVASHYNRLLARAKFKRPAPPPHCRHGYHVYAVEVEHRDQVQKALGAAGIGTGIHYPVPVHLQKAYADLGYGRGDLPVTETLANRFLSLPIYAELEPTQVANVALELENVALVQAG